MHNEPTVTVNGQRLSDGEVMTIRVALNSLIGDMLEPNALGDDEHGKAMASGYQKCATATLVKMSNAEVSDRRPAASDSRETHNGGSLH